MAFPKNVPAHVTLRLYVEAMGESSSRFSIAVAALVSSARYRLCAELQSEFLLDEGVKRFV
jgi:hypothetical protein